MKLEIKKIYKRLLSIEPKKLPFLRGGKILHSPFSILHSRSAFTLVELLVSIALFSIIVSIAAGGFTRALRTQRQVIALIAANSNMSLALEQMAREMRTSINFLCFGGGNECQELSFINARNELVTYRLADQGLERGTGGNFERITADNVVVNYLTFRLLNNALYPPRITVILGVSAAQVGIAESVTKIQTTISGRQF